MILASLAAILLSLYASKSTSETGPPVEVSSPFGLYSPGTLDEVPADAGRMMLEALGVDSLPAFQDYTIGLIRELGISWVRIDILFDGFGFQVPAEYLEKLHNAGIDVVACARPRDRAVPDDLGGFKEELRRLVGNYPWIKVWQIGNEPNLSWDNPDDYPRFFFAGRSAVKDACPDCRIALAGAGARYPSQPPSQQEVLSIYDGLIGDIVDQAPAGGPPFDIFDMHYYGYFGGDNDVLRSIRSFGDLLGKHGLSKGVELWVTETATTNGQPAWPPETPLQTEDQQAAELIRRFATMLGAGVARVSWARPYENYLYGGDQGNYYNNAGLVYNGLGEEAAEGIKAGTRKKAFFAYKTLVAKLSGCTHAQRLGPGRYRFSFDDGRSPIYILWNDDGMGGSPVEIAGAVTVTDMEGVRSDTWSDQVVPGPMPIFVESR